MSHRTQPAALTGQQARVRLRNGNVYDGVATIHDGMISIDHCRLRVVSLIRGRRTVTYRRPARRRTFALELVRNIDWR